MKDTFLLTDIDNIVARVIDDTAETVPIIRKIRNFFVLKMLDLNKQSLIGIILFFFIMNPFFE